VYFERQAKAREKIPFSKLVFDKTLDANFRVNALRKAILTTDKQKL